MMQDKIFVLKKLGFSEAEFDKIMGEPAKAFMDYPNYENSWYYSLLRKLYRTFLRKK